MSWGNDGEVYERIIRKKVADTEYNLSISEQKYRQDKAAHETALRELESCLKDKEEQKIADFKRAVEDQIFVDFMKVVVK